MKTLLTSKAPAAPSLSFILYSFIGAFLAIAGTGWLSHVTYSPWLMAPFGASCVLIFGLPDSPLSQPRHIIGGHFISATIGFCVLYIFGNDWWALGIAVASALALMQITRTTHAPAGATPLVVMATQPNWVFLIYPVLLGSLIIVCVGFMINNLRQSKSYPKYWL